MQDNLPPVTPSSFSVPIGEPKNNSLAMVSLGLSLAGLPFLCFSVMLTFCGCFAGLLGLSALITGFIARNQIKISGEKGSGMALAGMIIGGSQILLVICFAIFALAIALVPALGELFSNLSSGLK